MVFLKNNILWNLYAALWSLPYNGLSRPLFVSFHTGTPRPLTALIVKEKKILTHK